MGDKKIPRKRKGFYYKEDRAYPSVTKILGCLDKPALFYWAIKMASEIALEDPSLSLQEIRSGVLGISKKAAERGKEVHSVAEEWAKSGNIGRVPAHQGYVDAFQSWVETVKPRASESEVELFSEEYGYAGRCDIVVDINDTLWLIDVKTGKGIYKETGLQLVAYRQALMEMGIAEVDKMGVVLCKEDGEFVFQETKSVIEDFVNVQRVWEWYQKKED